MRAAVTAALASLALFGCTAEDGAPSPPQGSDASGFAEVDAAVADAAVADAGVADAAPDAAPIPATVDADPCLYLLQGPAGSFPKVVCGADTGPFCNADNHVCMPNGSEVLVTGAATADPDQEICTEWYPVTFRSYEGFSCGDYLVLP